MEKRSLLAITIAFLILILWSWLFKPEKQVPPPQADQPKQAETATAVTGTGKADVVQPELGQATQESMVIPENIQPVMDSEEKEITVENPLCIIKFSNRGGVVQSWRLKDYLDDEGKPLELIAPQSKDFNIFPLQIRTDDNARDAKIHSGLFVVSTEQGTVKGNAGEDLKGQIVRFRLADEYGLLVEKQLELPDESYMGSLQFSVSEAGKSLQSSIVWGSSFGSGGGSANRFYYSGQCVANIGGKLFRQLSKNVPDPKSIQGEIRWAGLDDQYFSTIFIPLSAVDHLDIFPSKRKVENGKEESYLNVALPDTEKGYKLFVGPKNYHLLTAAGSNLDQIINFGSWSVIALIAKGLFISLIWLYNHTIPNYGFGIILITLAIRIIFFPLTQKSFVKMKKMQNQMKKIQPKINSIKERYHKKKGDYQAKQKMNQEIMELYKKEGINPLGGMSGCLPLLIQLPILWGFYNVLTIAIELRKAPFVFWIDDLSVKDPYYITPLLMGATMLIQQKMSGPAGGDPFQQKMMMFMPLFFTFFFFSFPSGLVLYWLANNVLGIGQQYLINREAERLLAATKEQ